MTIHQCDLCGTDIGSANDVVKAGYHTYGFLASEFCEDCGKPVVQFLTRIEKKLKARKTPRITARDLETRMKKLEDALPALSADRQAAGRPHRLAKSLHPSVDQVAPLDNQATTRHI